MSDVTDLTSYRARRDRSLYATARSLTALGELDEVLASIVHEAHELIGTDFTYLSLIGADGELTLKAAEGTISPAFKRAHIPSGVGVGGRVIATGAPAWVSNYLRAGDVPHDRTFDGLVAPEGMVALLGVPLLVGDEVIGVLFAADRTERPFEPDEVALLSAFADHAAVALNNARLYDESRAELEQLRAASRTLEAITQVGLTGGGADDIARILSDHLRGTVTVHDRAGCPTGPGNTEVAIRAGDTHLGSLVLAGRHEPSPVDLRTLERAAQIMGLILGKDTAVAEAEERVSGELLTELLVSAPPVTPSQQARAHARGIDLAALNVVVVAQSDTRPVAEVSRRLYALSSRWNGLAGDHLGRAALLAPAPDPARFAEIVHSHLRRELGSPVRVVAERLAGRRGASAFDVADPVAGRREASAFDAADSVAGQRWASAFDIAGECCDLMRALGVTDRGSTTEPYAMFALLFDTTRADDLRRFLDTALGPLLAHDRRRSTHLVATLSTYFRNAGNVTRTAAALHVHVNTLLKRLDRVDRILGPQWRTPDRSLQLQVALRLHELSAPLP